MDNGNDVLMEDLLSKIAEENREQFIEDLFESGATHKQLYGIPDSLMNGFYACAYEYYQKGEIEKAEHFFKFLMMYDFYNPDYAFGLAAVYQLKQDYKHALDIYAIAYALDDDNLRAIFEAGQCYMHLHNYSKARDSFGEVVAHEKDPELVKRAEVYLKALTKINDSDEDHYHVRNSK
ncbi:SycD/LcrH family type III secretion system chaperone [Citrobacter freundii]|nr:SycD/LcrH family type III secretion system chaperone [Citrobacter freundii]